MSYINEMTVRYPALESVKNAILLAVELIVSAHRNGKKILLVGNGGSAADCEHVAGELLKSFMIKRVPEGEEMCSLRRELGEGAGLLERGVRAIPLPSITAAMTAYANDKSPEYVYAQLVYALGVSGDVLLAFSTSGNSKNVLNAARCAKAMGIKVVAFTGEGGGALASLADTLIAVPERETYKIQEYHLPVYHSICAEVEQILFGKKVKM